MTNSTWVLDPAHSEVNFSVKHMMISKVNGTFHNFDAKLFADPTDLTSAEVEFSVDLSSIDTRNDGRDGHLKSADFFDVDNFPNMTFKSSKVVKTGEDEYAVTGDLSIRGVTLPQTFKVVVEGIAKNPMSGAETVGFTVDGKINRGDYGLVWNAALETGGVLVGDEVKVSLAVEAYKD